MTLPSSSVKLLVINRFNVKNYDYDIMEREGSPINNFYGAYKDSKLACMRKYTLESSALYTLCMVGLNLIMQMSCHSLRKTAKSFFCLNFNYLKNQKDAASPADYSLTL
jgi:hypothetical protein